MPILRTDDGAGHLRVTKHEIEPTPAFETKIVRNSVQLTLNAYIPEHKKWKTRHHQGSIVIPTDWVEVSNLFILFNFCMHVHLGACFRYPLDW